MSSYYIFLCLFSPVLGDVFRYRVLWIESHRHQSWNLTRHRVPGEEGGRERSWVGRRREGEGPGRERWYEGGKARQGKARQGRHKVKPEHTHIQVFPRPGTPRLPSMDPDISRARRVSSLQRPASSSHEAPRDVVVRPAPRMSISFLRLINPPGGTRGM